MYTSTKNLFCREKREREQAVDVYRDYAKKL